MPIRVDVWTKRREIKVQIGYRACLHDEDMQSLLGRNRMDKTLMAS